MKKVVVGIDISPLYSAHKVRGVGFYTQRLLAELKKLEGLEVKELKTKRAIRRREYDLLHIPYFNPYFFTIPFHRKTPLAVTVHDLIPLKYSDHYPPGKKGRLIWTIQKLLFKKTDLIITDSFASRADIAKITKYPENKIKTVYLAGDNKFTVVEDKKQLMAARRKYRLPEKFVLYVGDVNWNKNVPGLVRACRKINIPLVIVGRQAADKNLDPYHPENKDWVWLKKRIDGKMVIALGFLPTIDLAAIYNLAALYCQPSFDEGFGLPVLEAMSAGCPVISSNRGSLPEVVGKAGILVDPSINSLSAAIERLLGSVFLRNKLSRAGRRQAGKFSWRKTAREVFGVYQAVCRQI